MDLRTEEGALRENPARPDTLPNLFWDFCQRKWDREIVRWKHREVWVGHRGREMFAEAQALALWLENEGVQAGDRVGVLSATVPAWGLLDMAILCLRAVTVGVYTTLATEQVRYVLDHAGIEVLFCQSEALLERVRSVWPKLPALRRVVLLDDRDGLGGLAAFPEQAASARAAADGRLGTLSAARTEGAALVAGRPDRFRALMAAALPDDLATLIYTSGTTGPPKGVMLTHRNLARTARIAAAVGDLRPTDWGVAFLPMAHALMRIATYTGLVAGVGGAYAPSIERLLETWRDVAPTVQASVPRIWEKAYQRIQVRLAAAPAIGRALFGWAIAAGRRRAEAERAGRELGWWDRARAALADRLVLRRIRALFGGRTRHLTSGGAPISVELLELFHAMGILVLEAYGLTETSGPVTLNTRSALRFGTVGRVLPETELRIARDGEILVRGPGVFRGYYRAEEATKEVLDADGWFRTGDIGELDADGFLRITDRKKNLIVTAQGKNVAPATVEAAIRRQLPWLEHVYVHGDRRPYVVALVTVDQETRELERKLEEKIGRGFDAANEQLARYEQAKRWMLLPEGFTEEAGLLTPTRKLKRRAVAERYQETIDELYARSQTR